MSDIKEALVHSEQNAITALGATGKACKFPVIALPSGVQVHDLEEYQECRNQFRGKLSTHLIKDFLAYTNQQPVGACFVDSKDMHALSIFDIGDNDKPGHCKHQAHISLKNTAAYREIISINDSRVDQRYLAEFIEDWEENIIALDADKKTMDIKEVIHSVRNLSIEESVQAEHGVGQFSVNKSSIEELNATGKDKKPLPGYLEFSAVPYLGLSSYKFVLRVSLVISKHKSPEFHIRIIKLDEIQETMNDEFFELIDKDMDEKIKLYTGSFNSRG